MAILLAFIEVLPYIVLVLAVVGILIFYLLWEKKRNEPTHNDSYYKQIVEAVGDIDNIADEMMEHKRVQLILKDTKKVDIKKLKSLEISAFLTGNKITLLIHEQGERLLDHMKRQRKEER